MFFKYNSKLYRTKSHNIYLFKYTTIKKKHESNSIFRQNFHKILQNVRILTLPLLWKIFQSIFYSIIKGCWNIGNKFHPSLKEIITITCNPSRRFSTESILRSGFSSCRKRFACGETIWNSFPPSPSSLVLSREGETRGHYAAREDLSPFATGSRRATLMRNLNLSRH